MKKRFACISFSLLLFVAISQAQKTNTNTSPDSIHNNMRKHFGERMQRMHRNIQHQLNLTYEQQKRLKSLHEDYAKKLADLAKDNDMTMGEYRKKRAALQQEQKEQMQNVFTPEQKNKLAELKQKAQDKMQQAREARLQKMKQQLNLTDEQVASIKSKQEDLHTQMKNVFSDNTLLPDEKKEKLRSLMDQQKENFNSVLTQDQLDKLQDMKRNNGTK